MLQLTGVISSFSSPSVITPTITHKWQMLTGWSVCQHEASLNSHYWEFAVCKFVNEFCTWWETLTQSLCFYNHSDISRYKPIQWWTVSLLIHRRYSQQWVDTIPIPWFYQLSPVTGSLLALSLWYPEKWKESLALQPWNLSTKLDCTAANCPLVYCCLQKPLVPCSMPATVNRTTTKKDIFWIMKRLVICMSFSQSVKGVHLYIFTDLSSVLGLDILLFMVG